MTRRYVYHEVLTFVPNEKFVEAKNMTKQELLQKVLELNKKTKALKKTVGAEETIRTLREIRALETEIAAAKVTP
ncbi:hypothetical protein MUO79_01075 [Candidatus Bathyarchaeota archaeon]|nr:hypothetical protein [Candidatus Bathyarchaeota archaeon]